MAPSLGSRILDDIAELIGDEAALRLSWRFRGLDLYIPQSLKTGRGPDIVATIGEDKAQLLIENFDTLTITIPKRPGERYMVAKLAEGNRTRPEIAEELGIGERQVYRILQSLKDDRQKELPFS